MFEQGMKVAGWFVDQMEAHGWDIVGVFDDEAEEFERCGRADAFELLANLDECNMLFERGPYTVTVLMIPLTEFTIWRLTALRYSTRISPSTEGILKWVRGLFCLSA